MPFDVNRVLAASFVRQVDYHDELASTNDRAMQLAGRDGLIGPLLVLTEHQRDGRGRGTNRWWSAAGALTFSLAIQAKDYDLHLGNWSRTSLAAALAVCEAIREVLPGHDVRLKWPNDVHLQGRKVSGILVEAVPARAGVLVIGIGLNVNNSLETAPEQLRLSATSLIDVASHAFDLTQLLLLILRHLAAVLQERNPQTSLSDRWQQLCMLHGRTLCVGSGGQQLVGVCQGIDEDGALLLHTEAGIERCFGGVVRAIY